MELRVLGPVELVGDDGPVELRRGRPRRLLLALVARMGEPVGSEALIDELWADDAPQNAGNALQVLVSYLRRTLSAADDQPRIETTQAGYRLRIERDELDATRFEDAITALPELTDPARRVEHLDRALSWWRGAPLMEATYDDFATGMIVHLNELRLAALELRIEARLALGAHREVIGELRQLVTEHPLNERFHLQLMLALYRSDRQADALRAYEAARTTLVEELGLDPGPELQAMERAVLDRSDTLAAPVLVPSSATLDDGGGDGDGGNGRGPRDRRAGGRDDGGPDGRAAVPPAADAGPPDGSPAGPVRTHTGHRLVGRAGAVEHLQALMAEHPVVTLTGTGGAGKTRLAEAVADAVADPAGNATGRPIDATGRPPADAPAPVWWADLAPLRDRDGVLATLGATTGVASRADDAADALVAHLAPRSGVLVLDTCEHLVDEVAPIAARIAAACPGVRVLATSRQPLRIPAELAWPVPPLELPDPRHLDLSIRDLPSVELFCERAASVRAGFAIDEGNAEAIGRICLLLDGVPLAIELAAAQVALLRPERLLRLLDDRLRVLVDDREIERQQTLRATIDWSYQLLDEDEARFLDRLSVFAGSFDIEAAVVVAGDGLTRDGYDLLVSLSRQSLVAVAGDDRFRLLETIRAYAVERLEEGDADEVRRCHAAWGCDLVEEADRHLRGRDAEGWLAAVRRELPDLRVAISWAFAGGDPPLGARMAVALSWFCGMEGLFTDAQRWLEQAAAIAEVEPAVEAAILMGQADQAASLGELELAVAKAEAAVARYEQIGDRWALARCHLYLGVSLWGLGRLDEAAEVQDRMASIFRALGDEWGFALALLLRGRTGIDRDEPDVDERLDTALAIARRSGDLHVIGLCLEQRARVALHAGDIELAIELGQQSLEHNQRVGYVEGVIASLHALGGALAATGRTVEARALHDEAMGLAVEIDHPGAMAEGLECLALLDVDADPVGALTGLAAADALRERRSVPRPRSFERTIAPARQAAASGLGEDEVARAVRAGRLFDVYERRAAVR